MLVTSVAEAVKARRSGSKIDHDKKERRQGVKPKIGADPRQADRQDNGGRRSVSDHMDERAGEQHKRKDESAAIDDCRGGRAAAQQNRNDSENKQSRIAQQKKCDTHQESPLSRGLPRETIRGRDGGRVS